jgi:type III secretory pathway component EscR
MIKRNKLLIIFLISFFIGTFITISISYHLHKNSQEKRKGINKNTILYCISAVLLLFCLIYYITAINEQFNNSNLNRRRKREEKNRKDEHRLLVLPETNMVPEHLIKI